MQTDISQNLSVFFSKYKTQKFKKGISLIRGGEDPACVYYLKKGYVKMSSIFANGSELTLNIFKPGTFFPAIWLIGGIDNVYYYQTISTAQVIKAPKIETLDFLENNTGIYHDLTKRLLIGLDGLLQNIQYLLYGNSTSRVASAILVSAKRFGKRFKNGSVLIDLTLTHQEIANLAGIARETTSIIIKKFERSGIITQSHKKIIILNLKRLESEAIYTN